MRMFVSFLFLLFHTLEINAQTSQVSSKYYFFKSSYTFGYQQVLDNKMIFELKPDSSFKIVHYKTEKKDASKANIAEKVILIGKYTITSDSVLHFEITDKKSEYFNQVVFNKCSSLDFNYDILLGNLRFLHEEIRIRNYPFGAFNIISQKAVSEIELEYQTWKQEQNKKKLFLVSLHSR